MGSLDQLIYVYRPWWDVYGYVAMAAMSYSAAACCRMMAEVCVQSEQATLCSM